MTPPKKRQKKSNTTVNNENTNTVTSGLSIGDRPVRQRVSRFSRPRQLTIVLLNIAKMNNRMQYLT
jgi:hypothetical protein